MATSRVINTNFWKDTYIFKLSPTEKLLFLYFLTNPRTTLAGVYEINLLEIEFDTKITEKDIQLALAKFEKDGKIYFERDWIIVTNFIKHQRLNPSIVRGIERAIDELPEWLKNKIDLDEDEDKQLSIFVTDSTQSVSVSTSPVHLKKLKEIKRKEKKPNETDKSEGSNKFEKDFKTPEQKRAYALAKKADEEQLAKAQASITRKSSGTESFKQAQERLRNRK